MICEVLYVLAGHKSSIFTPDGQITPDFLPLLHPGEVQTLEGIAALATRYLRVKKAATYFRLALKVHALGSNTTGSSGDASTSLPSEYLSTLGAAITNVLHEYEALVVKTEERILKKDDELVGGQAFVPLSSIRAVFAVWEAPLAALDLLVATIYTGPGQKVSVETPRTWDEGYTIPEWPAGHLIDLLLLRAETGVHRVSHIMSELAVALQRLWRIHLTAFLLHGSLSPLDPLALPPSSNKSETPTSHLRENMSTRILTALILNEKAIPSCVSPQTQESILYIGKAVAIVKAQGQAQKQIPRQMIVEHAQLLERVLPQDGFSFDRVIAQMRSAVSEFLWTHVLKDKDVEDVVESLANYFLLRNGEFAVALIREIERLKINRLSALNPRSIGIREQDLSLALLRASLGTNAQHDPSLSKLRFNLPTGPVRAFVPYASLNRTMSGGVSLSEFSDYLLGTPLVLNYALEWPLDLFLVPSDLQIYSQLFAYFSAIRRAQTITLECWTSLSNAQRSRRRWTGWNEGGTQDSVARMHLLRCGWGVLRQMLWFLDTLWGYLMNDVVGTQHRRFIEQLKPPTHHLEPRISPRKVVGHTTGSTESPKTEKPRRSSVGSTLDSERAPGSKSHIDFNTLRSIHSNYLTSLLTGSLLGNPTCATLIRAILGVCERFVGQVERWGGDVLPALLSEGSLSSKGTDVGQVVQERWAVVQEMDETLNEHLHAFYQHLSENPSSLAGGLDGSVLFNSTAALGMSVLRNQTTTKANGASEREGDAARQVEHLLLRLDFNSALSAPPKPSTASVLPEE